MTIHKLLCSDNRLITNDGSLFIANLINNLGLKSLKLHILGDVVDVPAISVLYLYRRVNNEIGRLIEEVDYSSLYTEILFELIKKNTKVDDIDNDIIVRKSLICMHSIDKTYEKFVDCVNIEFKDRWIVLNDKILFPLSYGNLILEETDELLLDKLFYMMLKTNGVCGTYNLVGVMEVINQIENNVLWGIPHITDGKFPIVEKKPDLVEIDIWYSLTTIRRIYNAPREPLDILLNNS